MGAETWLCHGYERQWHACHAARTAVQRFEATAILCASSMHARQLWGGGTHISFQTNRCHNCPCAPQQHERVRSAALHTQLLAAEACSQADMERMQAQIQHMDDELHALQQERAMQQQQQAQLQAQLQHAAQDLATSRTQLHSAETELEGVREKAAAERTMLQEQVDAMDHVKGQLMERLARCVLRPCLNAVFDRAELLLGGSNATG